jgi:hypothetical protein
VKGVQTGILDDVRAGLGDKQQAAIDYGVGALVSGATRFVFGREVVEASLTAFAEAPESFPDYLDVPARPEKFDDESSRGLEALENAAKAVGVRVNTGAAAVGGAEGIRTPGLLMASETKSETTTVRPTADQRGTGHVRLRGAAREQGLTLTQGQGQGCRLVSGPPRSKPSRSAYSSSPTATSRCSRASI